MKKRDDDLYNPIAERVKERHLLLAAHRRNCGDSIPCNSLTAYEITLNSGADIVEIDVNAVENSPSYRWYRGKITVWNSFGAEIYISKQKQSHLLAGIHRYDAQERKCVRANLISYRQTG